MEEWVLKESKSKPGKYYYFNMKTGISTWIRPEGFSSKESCEASASAARKPPIRKSDTNINDKHEVIAASLEVEVLPKKRKIEVKQEADTTFQKDNESVKLRPKRKSSQIYSVHDVLACSKENADLSYPEVSSPSSLSGTVLDASKTSRANIHRLKVFHKSKEKAQERLLKLRTVLTRQAKKIPQETCFSVDSKRNLVIEKNDSCSLTGQRIHIAEISGSGEKSHNVEPMEVEYMESEVLFDIEKLRQNNVNVDLTSTPGFMDVDMEPASDKTESKSITYIVLDTNILLAHLKFASELLECSLSGRGPAHIFIPWQVLHELDRLKDSQTLSIAPLARRAINFLHDMFSTKHPRVHGQKISEAAKSFSSRCADDNILQSCLQLQEQSLDVILLSSDINLRNKALVSDVNAVSKDKLEGQIFKDSDAPLTSNPHLNLSNTPAEAVRSKANEGIDEASLTALKAIIAHFLSAVVSKGMEDVYKHLWRKRTIRPPPWDHDQVLLCLSKHWLPICDDSLPPPVGEVIEKLRILTKHAAPNISISDLEECFELTKAVFHSVSKKYSFVTEAALSKLKELEMKLSGNSSFLKENSSLSAVKDTTSTLPVVKHDERIHLVFMCFEEAHNAALNICKAEYLVDSDHVQRAKCMMDAVGRLIDLLNMVLAIPIDSLQEDNAVVNELTSLVKGDSSITPSDLVLFLKSDTYRALIENGITQFISFQIQLGQMLQEN